MVAGKILYEELKEQYYQKKFILQGRHLFFHVAPDDAWMSISCYQLIGALINYSSPYRSGYYRWP